MRLSKNHKNKFDYTGTLTAFTCIGNPFSATNGCAPVELAVACGGLASASCAAADAAGAAAAVEAASAPLDEGCFRDTSDRCRCKVIAAVQGRE